MRPNKKTDRSGHQMEMLAAIRYVVTNGPRWSEWAESSLLQTIDKILREEIVLTRRNLDLEIEKAKKA